MSFATDTNNLATRRLEIHLEDIPLGNSGGVENFARGVVRGFATVAREYRFEVSLVVARGRGDSWLKACDVCVPFREVRIGSGGRTSTSRRLLRRFQVFHKIRAVSRRVGSLRSGQTEAVQYFPYHRVRTSGSPKFVTVHDLRAFSDLFADKPSQMNISANIRESSGVFVAWRHPKQEINRLFPEEAWKVSEVPFPPMLPARIDRKPVESFLLYPAATSPHKNHEVLVKYVKNADRPMDVVCCGPIVEPIYSTLVDTLRDCNGSEKLSFQGRVSDEELADLYARCWAVVLPTKYEAASGPLMEAVAAGVPVIAAQIPPIVAQVHQMGAEVVWFDPDDWQSLDDAVTRLAEKYEDYVASLSAPRAWLDSLTWNRTAHRYLAQIQESLSVVGGPIS